MRLITYRGERGARAGAAPRQRGRRRLATPWDDPPGRSRRPGSARGRSPDDLAIAVDRADPFDTLAGVELLPPVPDPEKIVCIGLNYRDHAAEAGQEPPPVPTFFAKFANALVADGATVPLPASS